MTKTEKASKRVTEGVTASQVVAYLNGRPLLQRVGVSKAKAASSTPKPQPQPLRK